MPLSRYSKIIEETSIIHSLDKLLVSAIVLAESGGNTFAVRYEPAWSYHLSVRSFAELIGCSRETEKIGQATSWGLCIAEGERVLTSSGWKPIEQINSGDIIVNRSGNFDKVIATCNSGIKECIQIKLGLNEPINLTKNHKVWSKKSSIGLHRTGRRKILTDNTPEFINAENLSEWDFIGFPSDTKIIDVDVLDISEFVVREDSWKNPYEYIVDKEYIYINYKSGGREKNRTKRYIDVNKEFMELLGLYMAEGHGLEKNKGVGFSFHINEVDLHKRAIELCNIVFGKSHNYCINKREETNSAQVFVYGPGPAFLKKIVPNIAKYKVLPEFAMWLPPEKQKWFFLGCFLGDGCRRYAKVTTASVELAYQLALILQRLGIVPRIGKAKNHGGYHYDVMVNSHKSVQTLNSQLTNLCEWVQTESLGLRRNNKTDWHCDSDFIYFPVRSVENSGFKNTYDLQIEDDSTFCIGRSIVHNCQVIGTVAREHNFRGWFPELCRPELGILYGCKHLKKFFGIYRTTEDVVAAYNAGGVRKTKGGMYENQRYVDKVMKIYRQLEREKFN